MKRLNLIGSVFGDLNIIDYGQDKISKGGNTIRYWKVNCKCGKEFEVQTCHLKSGATKRCRKCSNQKKELNGKLSARFFRRIKTNAIIRNIYFDSKITREYLDDLIQKQEYKCAISKSPIKFSKLDYGNSASLDRIDSTKDYQIGNLHWVHKDINRMKGQLSMEYFIKLCKGVALWQVNQKI